jgi:hypothetical protein
MRETRWDPKLSSILLRQFRRNPLPKRGRRAPNVHHHIQHRASKHSNQLALSMRGQLKVQTTKHTFGRTGVVILHEAHPSPNCIVNRSLVVGLGEPTSIVAEPTRG